MTNIFIRTYGCSLNTSDSEVLAGLLEKAGFTIVDSDEKAILVIINSCAVKKPTEDKILAYIKELEEKNKKILIAGCLPQTMPHLVAGHTLIGPTHITDIVEAVEETLNNNPITLLVPEDNNRLNLPSKRVQPYIEIIPISRGCLGDCAYCIVKIARGSLKSYAPEDILLQARRSIHRNAKEIWLTSQDLGSYGKDLNQDIRLPRILKELLHYNGEFIVRLGMMNPDQLNEILDDLLPLFESKKLYRFLHIPVQSGSDDILKRMNRKYSIETFRTLVEKIRTRYPDMTIATDIICAFPGEDEEQFKKTLKLIQNLKLSTVNISRYWDRKGTKAQRMKGKIAFEKAKERAAILKEAREWNAINTNRKWRGWKGSILINERGKNNTWIGRNYSYKSVIVKGDYHLGQKIDVEIVYSTIDDLIGEEINKNSIIIKTF
jgi:threonylcarbamoyladenosine tRNA methylthiotransferase CDKAL1